MSKRPVQRIAAASLVVAMFWQFGGFYRRYHGGYRIASGFSYDPTAFRGAAELIIETARSTDVAAVYLPLNFYDVGAKWRFYTQKHQQPGLWQRTRFFSGPSELAAAPSDTLAVLPQAGEDTPVPAQWTTLGVIRNLGGEPTAAVIRKD